MSGRRRAAVLSDELSGGNEPPGEVSFAGRLNRLFTVFPPGGQPYLSADVVNVLQREGIHVSAPYLSQLRTGVRTNPSSQTMAALARFFRVPLDYFTDDECFSKVNEDLVVLKAVSDRAVRGIVVRIIGLSPSARATVLAFVDELRDRDERHQ